MRNAKALGCGLLAVGIGWLLFIALPVAGAARAHLLAAAWRKAAGTLRDNSRTYTVRATAYEAVVSQTDGEPFVTADNSRIPRSYGSHTRWLALSRDLLRPWGGPFEFGDKVRVRGISPALDGVYTVHDTMNRRYRHCLDVLVHPREHVTISRAGVKIQRISPSRPRRNPSVLLTARRSSRTKQVAHAPRRARSHQTVAQHASRAPRRGRSRTALMAAAPRRAKQSSRHSKRGTPLAHQKHTATKKQLATLPKHAKKRVAARLHHLSAA
jgi:3D (Asp-Asp-Asp) domain-containing protein